MKPVLVEKSRQAGLSSLSQAFSTATRRCSCCRGLKRAQEGRLQAGVFTCRDCLPEAAQAPQAKPQRPCQAFGCPKATAPYLVMCTRHWHMVPQRLQLAVWAQYRHGQEIDQKPSVLFLVAAAHAINAVAERDGRTERQPIPEACHG